MHRGKPQQRIYTPGSGKLIRSSQGVENSSASETDSLKQFSANEEFQGKLNSDNEANKDSQKKSKKPEQVFYVPRAVAEARGKNTQIYVENADSLNGLEKDIVFSDKMNRSKRYSNNRSQDGNNSFNRNQNDWKNKSPGRNRMDRMESEPKGGFTNNYNYWDQNRDRDHYRERDTRSVEPLTVIGRNNNPDSVKIQAKPPSGRRHSTTGNYQYNSVMKNWDHLPPRLKKKYMEENGLTVENAGVWDGQGAVYQTSGTSHQPLYQPISSGHHSLDVYTTLPHQIAAPSYNSNVNYHTLPLRPRGRGRLQHSEPEFQPGTPFRSITPDRSSVPRSPINSRPNTPTRRFENKPFSRPPSRSQTPSNYLNDNRSISDNWPEKTEIRNESKSNVSERSSSRTGESGHLNRDRDRRASESGNRFRGDDNGRRERSSKERSNIEKKDHQRKGDRKKKNGRDRASANREFKRNNSKESDLSNDSGKTLTNETQNVITVALKPKETTLANNDSAIDKTKEVKSLLESRDILDWSEEVELNHRLEAEAFSDAMTRSSSITSLHELNSLSILTTPSAKKKKKSGRRRSRQRSDRDKTPISQSRKDSYDRDNFRMPEAHGRRRGSSKDHRDTSFDRFHNRSRGPSRDTSFDRNQENWREEIIRSRQNSEREGSVLSQRLGSDRSRKNSEVDSELVEAPNKKAPGLLVLPQPAALPELTNDRPSTERPKFPDIRRASVQQKTLFDPKNPNKPILVKSPGNRVSVPGFSENNAEAPKMDISDSSGKMGPNWYNELNESFKLSHYQDLLRDIRKADSEMQFIINGGMLLVNYDTVDNLRQFLKSALEFLLCKAIKFCQTENVEQHMWRILYYNIIEMTRKAIMDDPDNKTHYKAFLLFIIDEGTKYFERIIGLLEDTYNFKVTDYIGNNSMMQHKGLRFTGLALVSAQKIFMFLGDLGRYREQVNETTNYGKCRQWYIKSHEINPKNGKPYNRLAVLAVYSRRKLDAVYYYMRSLMSSNPVLSAKESLISLFDENRKKYEQGEKKRREERLERQRRHMKQKESENTDTPNYLRKETWIRPDGGRRLHRTTKALHDENDDSEEEDLASLSSVDVNKRFVTSYLHVHSKLITKIGMEGFQDAAMQMLKEFRALLQHSPVSLPCNRFLQLLALNMFAIESTQLKDTNLQQSASYRSELQERALIISLQMFNLILERCVSILEDHYGTFLDQAKAGSSLDCLPHDANVLLPAIKVWCDWMLCHTAVWNPPPSTHDFKVGPSGDLWSRLGLLMNILERMEHDVSDVFDNQPKEGYEPVRLPEDATLCGFTPLIFHDRETSYAPRNLEPESAQLRLRIAKLIFFGTVFLCGLEPPVLKLEIEDGRRVYVSVVCSDRGRDSPREETGLTRNDEVLLETFSDDEETSEDKPAFKSPDPSNETSSEIKDLLNRKLELEKRNRSQELHQQRVMKILSQSIVSVHLEIRPKHLVPDTNCFIDHLNSICIVAKSHTYTLMVPIVVLSELEGLSKGSPVSALSSTKSLANLDHIQKVAVASRAALDFLKKRHATVKCVTTKGAVLASTTFSTEDDATWDGAINNDDKILTTCLVLCKNYGKEQQHQRHQQAETKDNEPRHLFREVVLLTEDRNLRVKAHARDVPVRALPDFMRWASLGG